MRKILGWAQKSKLKFNENKSKVMIMSRRRRRGEKKEIQIYLNNKILKQVNSIKYLGIIFDSKMTFRDHINYVEKKCTKLIFSLSKSAKITWGLKHEALKTIYEYTGGILPLLLCMCVCMHVCMYVFETNSKITIIRDLYRDVHSLKKCYHPRTHIVNVEKGDLVTHSHSILATWRDHLPQLLNVHVINDIRQT